MNKLLPTLILLFTLSITFGQTYKEMMEDMNINFYDVIKEAERHFEGKSKGKGSGWKNFQRWVVENEHRYYPTGDRRRTDPYFVAKQYERFQKNNAPRSASPTGWTELGPSVIDEITGHYSAGLGRVETFYIDPSNTQKMYLGSRSGGFWKTTDGGTTWTSTTDGLVATGVDVITASPTNADEVLINTRNSQNGTTHGIYRSTNGGSTWSQTPFNPTNLGWGGLGTNRQIYKIRYHPTIANLIFVGTRDGLYRSTDNLTTWTTPVSSYDFTDIEFHPTNSNIVYAYAKDNKDVVYVSTDIGVTFTQVALTGNAGQQGSIAVSASCADCVYFGSSSGIWKSTNNGASFTFVNNPGQGRQGFAVSDLDDDNIMMGYVDAFFSTDGGMNFNQITYWSLGNTNGAGSGHQTSYNTSTNYIHADLRAAECYNGVFYAATDGFLVKSTDNGVTWTILSEGTGIRENYNLGVSQSNHYRTICGSQDNGTSIKHQSKWIEFTGGDGMEGLIHPLNDDWMMSSYQYGSRRVIKDGGYSSSGGTPTDGAGYWIAPLIYNPNNHMQIFHFNDYVYRSDDFAANWTKLGTPSFSGDIKFATIAENNSDLIIVNRNEYIELSTDGGQTFTSIKGTLPNYSITDVVFDPNDDNTIVVTYARYQNDNSKVYISHDQGGTWTNITHNLGDIPVRSAIIDHSAASTIYLGTEIGVYKKAMADNTWTLYSQDLPNMSIRELDIVYGTNTIRAATWGRGLWEYTLDGRSTYPSIKTTKITNTPTLDQPYENVDQYVTSTIDYSGTLTSVYVEWSVNTPTFGNTIAMTNTTGNTWVSSSPLPNYPVGTKMYFKVFAVGDASDVTETYKFMYEVHPNYTIADAIPKTAMNLDGTGSAHAIIPAMNLNTNTMTISAWVKPNGTQNSNAGIVFCRSGSTTSGLNFKSNNELGYHWAGGEWSWASGAVVPADEWSHLALVIEPTQATIYLNGEPYVRTGRNHAVEAFDGVTLIGRDNNSSSRAFNGDIDEVVIWKRAFTQDEIRLIRHLTQDKIIGVDTDLAAYFQFNEMAETAFDKSGNNLHATLNGNTSLVTSTVPVAGGVSQKMTISSTGQHNFNTVGLQMTFNVGGTTPNGDVVATRLDHTPANPPNANENLGYYWIVNNYGTNSSFTALDELKFTAQNSLPATFSNPSDITFYKRNSNEDLNQWTTMCMPTTIVGNDLSFDATCNITGFSQLHLLSAASALPVTLLDFRATAVNNELVNLEWQTSAEINNDFFTIERSKDAEEWEIVTTKEGAGNSNTRKEYAVIDPNPFIGKSYYRLKQTDFDGVFSYSDVKTVNIELQERGKVKIYPNPTENQITISALASELDNIKIYNVVGQDVTSNIMVMRENATRIIVDLSELTSGIYYLITKNSVNKVLKY